MKLLLPAEFPSVLPFLPSMPHDLAVRAVVACDAAGAVYADGTAAPKVALVSPHWGRLYLLGSPSAEAASEVAQLLERDVWPAARAAGQRVFTLGYPRPWQNDIPALLSGRRVEPANRQYYEWRGADLPPEAVPDGFALVAADHSLMAQTNIANLELLAEEMASERRSVADFLARSFGVVALHGDDLAGWCLSEYNTGGRCEIGIATLEPFQRRGLATAMGRKFLAMAREQGIGAVGWHCWKSNVPSAACALRIGLEHVADYPVHFGWYNEEDAPR